MKIPSLIVSALIVIYALIALLQLWTEFLPADLFMKVTVTFGIIAGAIIITALIRREYISEKRAKKDGYLD